MYNNHQQKTQNLISVTVKQSTVTEGSFGRWNLNLNLTSDFDRLKESLI